MFEVAAPQHRSNSAHAPARDPRWSLAVAILGSTMVFVDGTLVNVALPVIQRELAASVTVMQWVVEAYSLLLASLVLIGGALGDRYGRRKVFAIGAVIFALASAGCGLAPSSIALVYARALQGAGGALLVPGSLALISAAYPERERGAAIGTWSAASSVTSALGPVLGGWVVAHASWRWLFWFNLPIGLLVALLATRHVLESRDDSAPRRMDWTGALLAIASLGLIVYGLLERSDENGSPERALTGMTLGAVLLAGFVWVEARSSAPMVPLSLFRSRTFSGSNLLTLLLYAALGAVLFFLPFDLIQVEHYSPPAAGAALLPFVLLISLLSRWAGGYAERHGARSMLVGGPLLVTAGLGLLALSGLRGSYLGSVLPGIVLIGAGMGVSVAPLTAAVMSSVDSRHAGVASGINNAVARSAGLLAIAGLGLILFASFGAALKHNLDALSLSLDLHELALQQSGKLAAPDLGFAPATLRGPIQDAFSCAFVSGFRALMLVSAGLTLCSAIAAAWFMKPTR